MLVRAARRRLCRARRVPVKLADLRERRRQVILRQAQLARSTLREQRSDVARIVSSWHRIVAKINAAVTRYEKSLEDSSGWPEIDSGLDKLKAGDLLGCMKDCREENQTSPLDSLDEALAAQVKELKSGARKSAQRQAKRAKKRARKEVARAKKRAKA